MAKAKVAQAKAKVTKAKMNEALEILNQASKERKDELSQMVSEKYSDLRSSFSGGLQVSKMAAQSQDAIKKAVEEGQSRVKVAAKDIDRQAHKKPWPFVAGAAAVGSAVTTGLMATIRSGRRDEED